jgi:hypothetical protein
MATEIITEYAFFSLTGSFVKAFWLNAGSHDRSLRNYVWQIFACVYLTLTLMFHLV